MKDDIGHEVVTVSEAAKRQIIYCSRRKIGTEREWDREDRGGKARASCYACIECNRDTQPPNNKGENTPRVQNATSGPVNSQAPP